MASAAFGSGVLTIMCPDCIAVSDAKCETRKLVAYLAEELEFFEEVTVVILVSLTLPLASRC